LVIWKLRHFILGNKFKISCNKKGKEIWTFVFDILAEDISDETVIIENQLEKTDHDHLGKILTYISNIDAEGAIWVSANPRLEHKKQLNG